VPHTLDWQRLLPDSRDGVTADVAPLARSPYQRDHDRILFSGPFRRLADKTQVFPLPIDDHVHSRLTHSLEVATIGRSLGNLVGRRLVDAGFTLPDGRDARDVGDCVAAACLAHDLGNPPFGHVGERAIREYFEQLAPAGLLDPLSERERRDLLRFEGNAQAFRILTRLEQPWRGRGLGLTHATLGAFMKYPCASDVPGSKAATGRSARKHGLMAGEIAAWSRAAEALGLARRTAGSDHWPRHPLAFLTEAADDMAYLLLDLEDGFRLKHVSEADYLRLVRPLAGASGASEDATRKLPYRGDQLDRAGWLRARAIDTLIHQFADAFLAKLDDILDGRFDDELKKSIPLAGELAEVERACIQQCYEARDVLKMELAGAEAIQGLLRHFVDALLAPRSLRGQHQRRLRGMVISDAGTRYDQLVRITDHVAGMTDNYAVRLYRELRGMRYPGGRD
jgi:dGTPase